MAGLSAKWRSIPGRENGWDKLRTCEGKGEWTVPCREAGVKSGRAFCALPTFLAFILNRSYNLFHLMMDDCELCWESCEAEFRLCQGSAMIDCSDCHRGGGGRCGEWWFDCLFVLLAGQNLRSFWGVLRCIQIVACSSSSLAISSWAIVHSSCFWSDFHFRQMVVATLWRMDLRRSGLGIGRLRLVRWLLWYRPRVRCRN